MIAGSVKVSTAGTRVQLSVSGQIAGVYFRARPSNTGYMYVGDSSVTSTNGLELEPGGAISIMWRESDSLQAWYVDASANSQYLDFVGVNA